MVRTRIAPSPTGFPHIGTIYQALFDYAWSKKNNGSFIVRIEDTDRERFVEGAEEKIYTALDWFKLQENESPRKGGEVGPYKQSERLPLYKKYAEELIKKGYAYYCFCTKERLEALRAVQQAEKKSAMYDKRCLSLSKQEITENLKAGSYVIRLKVPEDQQILVKDEIRGDISFDSNLIEDSVLLKSDGYPTYHLAVVVDDHLMNITHVVRGEEWLPSLPKHSLLYDYFGWEKPLFYHTPTLRNPDHSKLSKRQGHTEVAWYRENGFLSDAILNFLALLGWSHPEEKEDFDLSEFITLFNLKDIRPVAPIFDLTKLEWINGVHIRKMETGTLKEVLREFYVEDKKLSPIFKSKHIDLIVGLAQSRMKRLTDFKELVEPTSQQRELTEEEKGVALKLHKELSGLSHTDWMGDRILETLRNFNNAYGTSMRLLYFLITGREQGLPLVETMVKIEGREEILNRLNSYK